MQVRARPVFPAGSEGLVSEKTFHLRHGGTLFSRFGDQRFQKTCVPEEIYGPDCWRVRYGHLTN